MPGSSKTKVVLTVDVEPSVGGAFTDPRHTPLLDEPVGGEVKGRSEGLGFLIETLCGHGLTATFFVETVHTRYFGDLAMGRYAEQLVRAGQDYNCICTLTGCRFETAGASRACKLPTGAARLMFLS